MTATIRVKLPRTMETDLLAACRSRLPHEACGIIYGYKVDSTLVSDGFAIIRNVSTAAGVTFAFDRNEWIAACYEAQKNQRQIVGVFHSHPTGANAPSKQDEQALVPWESYWIIGFANPQGEIAAYRHTEQGWLTLPLVPA